MTRAALPNPVVIGTPKCGTTALHYYLGLHPQTSMSRPKELNFFQAEPDKSALGPDEQDMVGRERSTWSRGVDWYASHFDPTAPVRGESSPSYVAPWYRGVAERLAAVLPEARLVICVRDPVERAISHLHMRTAAGERREPADALVDPASGYVALGRYWSLLQPFLARFPPERLLVVDQHELLHRRRETMRSVFSFAGIDDSFWSPLMEREPNRSGRMGLRRRGMFRLRRMRAMQPAFHLPDGAKWRLERLAGAGGGEQRPRLEPQRRAELAALFADDVARLRTLTGKRFAGWSV